LDWRRDCHSDVHRCHVVLLQVSYGHRGCGAIHCSPASDAISHSDLVRRELYRVAIFFVLHRVTLASLSQRQRTGAIVWGFIAGLTRPVGWLLVLPLASTLKQRRSIAFSDSLVLISPVVGISIYCVYLWILTGNPLEWVAAQSRWGRQYASLGTLVRQFTANGLQPTDLMNVVAALFALGCVVPVWRAHGGHGLFIALSVLPQRTLGNTGVTKSRSWPKFAARR
jgi:hypothetical protein